MKARLEEAILGTIGARQEMVRRSRGESGVHPTPGPTSRSHPASGGPHAGPSPPLCPAHFSQKSMRHPHTHGCLCPHHLFSQVIQASLCVPSASTWAPRVLTGHPTRVPLCPCVSQSRVPLCARPSREEPVREPGERALAEERHALEADRGPRGQVGAAGRRPVPGETGASGA